MIDPTLREIVALQVQAYANFFSGDPPELNALLERALHPDEIRRALLKENPVLRGRRQPDVGALPPQQLREEAAAVGVLDATPHDVAFRRLYPSLDLGVYCAHHAMGKPSIALVPAVEEHVGSLSILGTDAWEGAGWADVIDSWRQAVAELVGGDLLRGDVLSFPNFSEGLCSLLFGLRGRLVTTAGHFTSGSYIHQAWAERTGGALTVVPVDDSGCVDAQRVIDALDSNTTIVSLSHAFWRNGFLQDIYVIAEAMMDVCPDAALLLDAYQTLGTVPLGIGRLPMRTAVLGGGLKQLRAGTGAGFAWVSHPLLQELVPDRLGWWAHREPLSFAPSLDPAPGGGRFRTGTPSLVPMVSMITELRALGTSGDGSLPAAVKRARLVTSLQMELAADLADDLGLQVEGPVSAQRRAAFIAIRVPHGDALVERLAAEGVLVDHRADAPGADTGLLRLSASAASYNYESLYAVERIAALLGER